MASYLLPDTRSTPDWMLPESRPAAGTLPAPATRTPRGSHTVARAASTMFVATETFAIELDGGVEVITEGADLVRGDHELVKRFPGKFKPVKTKTAGTRGVVRAYTGKTDGLATRPTGKR